MSRPRRDSHWAGVSNKVSLEDCTPAAVDKWVLKIENGVGVLSKCEEGATVKVNRAEMNLCAALDRVRDMIEIMIKQKDRDLLKECFGDCTRIVTLHTLLNQFELKRNPDERRLNVIKQVENVEEVLNDVGYGEMLRSMQEIAEKDGIDGLHAQQVDEQLADEPTSEAPLKELLPDLAEALVIGSQAVEQEEEGSLTEAMDSYDASYKALGSAIKVLQACAKFKASIGKTEAQQQLEEDVQKLVVYRDQVQERKEYLATLPEGEVPEKLVDDHIKVPALQIFRERPVRRGLLVMAACLGAAAGGGVLLGPFAGLLLAGVAVTGSALYIRDEAQKSKAAQAHDHAPGEKPRRSIENWGREARRSAAEPSGGATQDAFDKFSNLLLDDNYMDKLVEAAQAHDHASGEKPRRSIENWGREARRSASEPSGGETQATLEAAAAEDAAKKEG